MTQINSNTLEGNSSKKNIHSLMIDQRKHASISGVTDVCSFHETEIVLKIDSGIMVIGGQNLHVAKLLLEDGRLDIDGHIDSIVYEAPRKQIKHLFSWKWFNK